MSVLLWIGAALLLLGSVACGINLGSRVASGAEKVWSLPVVSWAVGFHGAAGVSALLLVSRARG